MVVAFDSALQMLMCLFRRRARQPSSKLPNAFELFRRGIEPTWPTKASTTTSSLDSSKSSTSGRRAWCVALERLSCVSRGLRELTQLSHSQAFNQICALTDVQEGTIVRAITRLDETCREVRDAARIVGNADLFTKMEQCQLKIRRDIVFAASLYF